LNRKCITDSAREDPRSIENTSTACAARSPEIAPLEQARGNAGAIEALEAAIMKVTRLVAQTDDAKDAARLVDERRAMRPEGSPSLI
jgi:hypothetical protein